MKLNWLLGQDSNLDYLIQSQVSCQLLYQAMVEAGRFELPMSWPQTKGVAITLRLGQLLFLLSMVERVEQGSTERYV